MASVTGESESEHHKIPSLYGGEPRGQPGSDSNTELAPSERSSLLMKAEKTPVSDTGLYNARAITWLAAWYIFSGAHSSHSSIRKQ